MINSNIQTNSNSQKQSLFEQTDKNYKEKNIYRINKYTVTFEDKHIESEYRKNSIP